MRLYKKLINTGKPGYVGVLDKDSGVIHDVPLVSGGMPNTGYAVPQYTLGMAREITLLPTG
jgi:hypothetical protein